MGQSFLDSTLTATLQTLLRMSHATGDVGVNDVVREGGVRGVRLKVPVETEEGGRGWMKTVAFIRICGMLNVSRSTDILRENTLSLVALLL